MPIVPHFLEPLVGTGSEGLADQLSAGSGLVKIPGLEAAQTLRARSVSIVSIPTDLTFAPLDGHASNVV